MNDFTKEELQHLHNLVDTEGWFPDIYAISPEMHRKYKQGFCDKIQSLIDNYCEHKDIYHVRNGDDEYSGCEDCGKRWS